MCQGYAILVWQDEESGISADPDFSILRQKKVKNKPFEERRRARLKRRGEADTTASKANLLEKKS